MKIYLCPDGRTYQYNEGEQPDGSIEVISTLKAEKKKADEPDVKVYKPANKARRATKK